MLSTTTYRVEQHSNTPPNSASHIPKGRAWVSALYVSVAVAEGGDGCKEAAGEDGGTKTAHVSRLITVLGALLVILTCGMYPVCR